MADGVGKCVTPTSSLKILLGTIHTTLVWFNDDCITGSKAKHLLFFCSTAFTAQSAEFIYTEAVDNLC